MNRRQWRMWPTEQELRSFCFISQNDCWEWQRCTDDSGYGLITIARKLYKTHRVMFGLRNGTIPDGLCVLHKCDNRKCINPDHLFIGTKKDNSVDCVSKGRIASGSKIGTSKLIEAQAVEIIQAGLKPYDRRIGVLANKFGVTANAIRCVATGKHWKYLNRTEIEPVA